ncbi:MAG TPA: hypothetical protein VJN18_09085 [Polyangiaceae bacterium]|nr:hypothetical protein [Polyangiaceae bacterium]
MTERPSDSGVPLRVVVALGLAASLLARCVAPALPGSMIGIESAITWTGRASSFLTLLAATGLVAGISRLAGIIMAARGAPLVARVVVVPSVAFGCLLLLFAIIRPLEPLLALVLGISAALVGTLSARHCLRDRKRRAGALVLGLISSAGLIHVLSRKLTQDASDAANLTVFRGAQLLETLASGLDLLALALTCVWLQRRARRGRLLVPLVLALSSVGVVLALRATLPGASTLSVLLKAGLDALQREQASLLPTSLGYMLSMTTLLSAGAALLGRAELGLILAASLVARGALDIPIPALMLELAALYLPLVSDAPNGSPAAEPPPPGPMPDTSPP